MRSTIFSVSMLLVLSSFAAPASALALSVTEPTRTVYAIVIDSEGNVIGEDEIQLNEGDQTTYCGGIAPLQVSCTGSASLNQCCTFLVWCDSLLGSGIVTNQGTTGTFAYRLDCYFVAGLLVTRSYSTAGGAYLGQTVAYRGSAGLMAGDWQVGIVN